MKYFVGYFSDPPLDDEDVPMGEWICHRCKNRPKPPPGALLKLPLLPQPMEFDDDTASVSSNRSRCSETATSRRSSRRASPVPLMSDAEVFNEIDMSKDQHPLQILAKAAGIMNPKQFELPFEMECNVPLPGILFLFAVFPCCYYAYECEFIGG